MTGFQQYITYFKNLAAQHTLIAHEDVSGKKAFLRGNIEELLTGFRTNIDTKGYILRALTPEWGTIDNRGGNPTKAMRCSITVTGYAPKDKFDKEEEVMDVSEQIIEDIINRMKADSENETPSENALFYKSLSTIQNINVYPQEGLDENRHGWMLTFTISPFFNTCVKNEHWKDLS